MHKGNVQGITSNKLGRQTWDVMKQRIAAAWVCQGLFMGHPLKVLSVNLNVLEPLFQVFLAGRSIALCTGVCQMPSEAGQDNWLQTLHHP